MEHNIHQYTLEPGAIEVQYIEECFTEFSDKKSASEIVKRLKDREHVILVSIAPSGDGDGNMIPVAYKIGHELKPHEINLELSALVSELRDVVEFPNRKFSMAGSVEPARSGAAGATTAP